MPSYLQSLSSIQDTKKILTHFINQTEGDLNSYLCRSWKYYSSPTPPYTHRALLRQLGITRATYHFSPYRFTSQWMFFWFCHRCVLWLSQESSIPFPNLCDLITLQLSFYMCMCLIHIFKQWRWKIHFAGLVHEIMGIAKYKICSSRQVWRGNSWCCSLTMEVVEGRLFSFSH